MTTPPEKHDLSLMRKLFHTVAPRYNLITRLFSYGMDSGWKREAVRRVPLRENATVLDLACGTGDFSRLVLQTLPRATAVASDLTCQMLQLARRSGVAIVLCADAMHLPFPDSTFDCVFVGYGLRNFPSLEPGLREIWRVTRPSGLLVSLDFFLPTNRVVRTIYLGYLYLQGAFWGLVLHRDPRVYTYIPDSLRSFVSFEEFSGVLRRVGYNSVGERRLIFGGIGLKWAAKVAASS